MSNTADYKARWNAEDKAKRRQAVDQWQRVVNRTGMHIDQEAVTHVFFAGEWHEVEPGTFVVCRVFIRGLWSDDEVKSDNDYGQWGFSFLTTRLIQVSGLREEIKGIKAHAITANPNSNNPRPAV